MNAVSEFEDEMGGICRVGGTVIEVTAYILSSASDSCPDSDLITTAADCFAAITELGGGLFWNDNFQSTSYRGYCSVYQDDFNSVIFNPEVTGVDDGTYFDSFAICRTGGTVDPDAASVYIATGGENCSLDDMIISQEDCEA
jgi:hypothetical protein